MHRPRNTTDPPCARGVRVVRARGARVVRALRARGACVVRALRARCACVVRALCVSGEPRGCARRGCGLRVVRAAAVRYPRPTYVMAR